MNKVPSEKIRITHDNINQWPTYVKLLNEGKIKFDQEGRLRHLHGAPVGDLILVKKNNATTYLESAEEWFDPDSQRATNFVWPT